MSLKSQDLILLSNFINEQILAISVDDYANYYVDVHTYDTSLLTSKFIYRENLQVLITDKILRETGGSFAVDGKKLLQRANLTYGYYRILVKIFKPILSSPTESNLVINKIASSRKEILIQYLGNDTSGAFRNFSRNNFYRFSEELPFNKYLSFKDGESILIVNAKNQQNGIVLKLYNPIPVAVQSSTMCWVLESTIDDIELTVKISLDEPDPLAYVNVLRPPNYNLEGTGIASEEYTSFSDYKTMDDLITTSSLSTELYNNLSSNIFKEYPISVEFNDFSNFIKFSSAVKRIENFKIKVNEIEVEKTTLASMSSGYITKDLVVSRDDKTFALYTHSENVKRIFDSFTPYERFLYFETGSFTTSSLYPDEIIDVTLPKTGTNILDQQPYSVLSTEFETWYERMGAMASEYDSYNSDLLYHIIPDYIKQDNENLDTNGTYINMVYMFGEFFDNIYAYIKGLELVRKRGEADSDGTIKSIIWNMLSEYGINANRTNSLVDIDRYLYGYYASGSNLQLLDTAEKNITEEIWKRLLNNVPIIVKSKGTENSIKYLLNSYGVPSTYVSIQEFGGPAFTVSGSELYKDTFYDTTHVLNMYGSQYISIPWITSSVDSEYIDSIEFKFRTDDIKTHQLLNISGSSGQVSVYLNSVSNDFGNVSLNIVSGSSSYTTSTGNYKLFDNEFCAVHLYRNTDYEYGIHLLKYDAYISKMFIDDKAELIVTGSDATTISAIYNSTKTVYLGGTQSNFSGQLDEFRMWSDLLSDSTFESHTKFSDSVSGNYSTSSVTELNFRLNFDSPVDLAVSSSLNNVAYVTSSYCTGSSVYGYSTVSTYPYQFSIYERSNTIVHSLAFDDLGTEKIRTESNWIPLSTTTSSYDGTSTIEILPLSGDYTVNGITPIGQVSEFDNKSNDSDLVLIGFRPTKNINTKILAMFGEQNIVNTFIGYDQENSDSYTGLADLNRTFWQYNVNVPKYSDVVKYFQMYDNDMFEQIRNLIPSEATPLVGIVNEQSILHRTKVSSHKNILVTRNKIKDIKSDTKIGLPTIGTMDIFDAVRNLDTIFEMNVVQYNISTHISSIMDTNIVSEISDIQCLISDTDKFNAIVSSYENMSVSVSGDSKSIVSTIDVLATSLDSDNNVLGSGVINLLDTSFSSDEQITSSDISILNGNVVFTCGSTIDSVLSTISSYRTPPPVTIQNNAIFAYNKPRRVKKHNKPISGKNTSLTTSDGKYPIDIVSSNKRNLQVNYSEVPKLNVKINKK